MEWAANALASRIAVEKITQMLPKHFGVREDRFEAYSDDILSELFRSIHEAMLDLGRHDPNCIDMGATLTLAWFRRDRIYFGHIGDTRLYLVRSNEPMTQVTEDHSHVGWLRRSGQLNERQARSHPRKNVLAQALGAGHRYLRPHMGVIKYEAGDSIVLCSDGVTDGLWDNRIEAMARESGVLDKGAKLVRAAVAESGRDNATAIVIDTLVSDDAD